MIAELSGWLVASLAGAAAAGLARSHRGRMEAVARACHELRGPLATVRLALELGSRSGRLSPERLKAVDLELGRAAVALDDLSCSRRRPVIGAHDVVDVAELVHDSVEAWRATAELSGIGLCERWDGPASWVIADRIRLAQALGNVIGNAIEHGGGAVCIEGRDCGRSVRIEVSDSGPGLPAPVAELVTAARRSETGRARGRGLAIACAVAAAHGGRLAAAPSERGARVVLELPRGWRDDAAG